MSILPVPLSRVSNQLRSSVASSNIARTQQQLLQVENEIATGQRVSVPSDDPSAAAIIQGLQKTLQQNDAYAGNITYASSQLGQVDSTLGDLTDLLTQAQTIASQNVGSTVTADQRKSAAAIVDSLYSQALSIANKQFNGVYLFGGDRSTAAPFQDQNGVVRFVGSDNVLSNSFDESSKLTFMVNGDQLFAATAAGVTGKNVAPALTAQTRLSDLSGASGTGVAPGSIRIGNGTTTVTVDLTGADTVGDVVNAINAAGLSGVTASLGTSGIVLTNGSGGNIIVGDAGNSTAADLGLITPGARAGGSLTGKDLGAKVTPLTKLADLGGGAGIDPAGLTITSGTSTAHISLATAATVEDLINAVNASGTGAHARINANGTGIDIVNANQSGSITISENGGNTAAELGLRSFTTATELASLNGGAGVRTASGGGADFQVTRSNGTSFSVSIGSAKTVQDVIDAINAADGGGGVTASFATAGNGIVLTDSSGGGGALTVAPLNASSAASDLGLLTPASGHTITGSDVGPVKASGLLANLASLRDALTSNDTTGITAAATALQNDFNRVNVTRGVAGARVKELSARQTELDDQKTSTKSLLSSLQDTDMVDAATRFQSLQTSLQATLQATAKAINLSLLDFLG